MVNKSKIKGTSFESAVVGFLNDKGIKVERRALKGNKDCGDIAGLDNWILELKATKELDLAGAVREAQDEAVNASTDFWAAVMKRRRAPISEAYVVLPLWMWAELYKEQASG